jgi:S1-C subfamily serine protease
MRYLKIFLLMTISVSLLVGSDAIGKKIYKWVDKKGVVHFSDRKPEETGETIKGSIEEKEVKERPPVNSERDSKVKIRARSTIEYTSNCTFTIKSAKHLGTGFFISSNGYAVTCKHVIEGSLDHIAQLNDQSEFPVEVIYSSYKYDLALILVITPAKTPHLSFRDAGTLIPGERLYAIGASAGLQATITDGVFTALRKRGSTGEKVIQFSAPINQGNSGGPLIDEKGRVVGVVSWKYVKRKGIPVTGVGFAIPAGYVMEEYSSFIE